MRETARDLDRLLHIKEAIENVQEFMAGKSFDDLQTDKLLYYAVVKNIEIIGEAAYKLSFEFKDANSETPWQDIIDMRHVLVHGYYTTSKGFIWSTIQTDIPLLKSQIEGYISTILK